MYLTCYAVIKGKSGYMIYGFGREDSMFELFNEYRLKESEQPHELAINYSNQNYLLDQHVQFFIGVDKDIPVLFSSIFRLEWWPKGAYRILNRLWKPIKDNTVTKTINPVFFKMVNQQLEWLVTQPDFRVAFVSRQGNSKQYLKYFAKQNRSYGNDMQAYSLPIRTCKGADCDCLQYVAYIGDGEIFKRWPNDT